MVPNRHQPAILQASDVWCSMPIPYPNLWCSRRSTFQPPGPMIWRYLKSSRSWSRKITAGKKPLSLIPVTYRVVIFWRRSTGEKLSWIVTIDVESNVGRIKRWMAMHFCMNGGFGTVLTCDIFSQRRFVQDDFADMWLYASQKQPLTLFLIANLAPLPNNIK